VLFGLLAVSNELFDFVAIKVEFHEVSRNLIRGGGILQWALEASAPATLSQVER
jgi:hypothetical protein